MQRFISGLFLSRVFIGPLGWSVCETDAQFGFSFILFFFFFLMLVHSFKILFFPNQTAPGSAMRVSVFGTQLKCLWVAPKISRLREIGSWQTLNAVAFSSSKVSQLFFNHTVILMVAPATQKKKKKICIAPLRQIQM